MRFALPVAVMLLLIAQPALGAIGLSPASARVSEMLRGGYAERYFTVSNPSSDMEDIIIGIEGSPAGWITVDPANFTLDAYSYGVFKAIIQPPNDTPNGGYSAIMLVISKPHTAPDISQTTGVAVSSAVAATISVDISDYQVLKFNVDGINLPDTEECRPITATINIRNVGNVRVNPRFVFDITGSDGTLVQHYEETTATVMPTQGPAVTVRVPYQLSQFGCIPQGRYKADIVSYAGDVIMDKSTASFNIFPRGQLALSGEILELIVPSNVTLGETVKIDAVFRNTGQLPVIAKPVIEVMSGPALVDTATGEESDVRMGGIVKLTTYWKPGMPGKYSLRATAMYEGHSTAPLEAQVEVFPPAWWYAAGIAIGVAIVVIGFIFLRRGKKKERKTTRRKR